MAHAQYSQSVRSCGKVSALSSQPLGSTGQPYTGTGFLELTPSLCVSERYDSNVFYAPSAPGLKKDDFVTNVNPSVRVNHNGEYASGYLDVGGFGETYARNSNLNYLGTTDTLHLNLDNSIKRLLPNATLLITDYVRYSQLPPGFSTPAAGTSPGSPVNIQNVYAQGLISYRANNLLNTSSVASSYATTSTTSLNASYTYSIIRFGSSPISTAAGLALFDTTTHTGTVGGKANVTPLDTLNLNYAHTQSEFTSHTSSTSTSSLFKVDTTTLSWIRTLTPYLTTQMGGGVIVIDPGLITYAVNASMTINTPNHNATISYARSAYPGFVGVGVPVVSDAVSVSAIQKLALQWELDEIASYSHSSGSSSQTAIKYDSYFAAVDLYYWITKMWSTALSFDYMNFNSEFGPSTSSFNRYAVTFSVKATWN